MAALLDIVDLRRHALPVHFVTDIDREIDRRAMPPRPRGAGERARPAMVWRIGPAGRPVCDWHIDDWHIDDWHVDGWHIDREGPDIPSG
jgi:hypothetical protein